MAKLNDYFNSTTFKGRANVAKATYASIAALYLYYRFRKNKKRALDDMLKNACAEKEAATGSTPLTEPTANSQITMPPLESNVYASTEKTIQPIESPDSGQSPSPGDSQITLDKTTIAGESVVKNSKLKCESGCNTNINPSSVSHEETHEDINILWTS